jgi:hypothetical protein
MAIISVIKSLLLINEPTEILAMHNYRKFRLMFCGRCNEE